jgi:hypothetical protein
MSPIFLVLTVMRRTGKVPVPRKTPGRVLPPRQDRDGHNSECE